MAIRGLSQGPVFLPPRVVIHGAQGLGKTTFAASGRNPVFLPTERGYDRLGPDRITSRPDEPGSVLESWADFKRALTDVAREEHAYETVVVDSADWLERLIHDDVAQNWEKPVKTIDEIGYGKGYLAAIACWREMLGLLDECNSRGMAVVVTAHSTIRRFDSPEVEPYDRYTLKLHESKGSGGGNATALLVEWADVVGFLRQRVITDSSDVGFNKKIVRGKTSGTRELCVVDVPAYAAKNRYGITKPIPLPEEGGWDAFEAALTERLAKQSAKRIQSGAAESARSAEGNK